MIAHSPSAVTRNDPILKYSDQFVTKPVFIQSRASDPGALHRANRRKDGGPRRGDLGYLGQSRHAQIRVGLSLACSQCCLQTVYIKP